MIKQIYGGVSGAAYTSYQNRLGFTYNLPDISEISTQIRKDESNKKRTHSIAKIFRAALLFGFGFLSNMPQANADDNGKADSAKQIDMKNSAGIVITEGRPAGEVLAIAEIKSYPKGISYDKYDKKSLTSNGFSLQLNLFAHIEIGNNKREQYLWLQNSRLFIDKGEGKWETLKGVDIFKVGKVIEYKEIPENMKSYYKRLKNVRGAEEMEEGEITAEAENGVKFVSEPHTNCLVYNGEAVATEFPLKIALDISVRKVNSGVVEIYFKDVPVRDGIIDWKNQKIIVSARYYDKNIKDVDMEFSKDSNAAMVTGGLGNGNYFVAQRFDAEFSMYAVNGKRGELVPLKLGDTTDNSTAEGITGVQVNQISPNKVEITSTITAESVKIRR